MIRLKSLLLESSVDIDLEKFKQGISNIESRGNYQAENPNSSAVGKYQFLWNIWKNKIKTVTGIDTKQDYLDNPDAQEQFMDHVILHDYINAVNKLKKEPSAEKYTDEQLMAMIHFQGLNGAKTYLKSGSIANASHNVSMDKYLNVAGFDNSSSKLDNTNKKTSTTLKNINQLYRMNDTADLTASLIDVDELQEIRELNETYIKLPKTLDLIYNKKIRIRNGINELVENTWRGFNPEFFNNITKFNGTINSIKKYTSDIFWGGVKINDILNVQITDIICIKFKTQTGLTDIIYTFIECTTTKSETFWVPTSWVEIN